MAHVSQEMKKQLAPAIKSICKKYGVKGTLAVRHHSTLVLNIKSGKIDFAKDSTSDNYNYQVNTYWTHEHYTGKAKQFFAEIIAAMKGPEFYDHSDAMIDYFCVSHYIDINLGNWNTPYIVTK
jgi:predicted glycoside hydrolase/deacetylase ChbG (UPF0249 family)